MDIFADAALVGPIGPSLGFGKEPLEYPGRSEGRARPTTTDSYDTDPLRRLREMH